MVRGPNLFWEGCLTLALALTFACTSNTEYELSVGPLEVTDPLEVGELCFVESCEVAPDAIPPDACQRVEKREGSPPLMLPFTIPDGAGAVRVALRNRDCSLAAVGCSPLPSSGNQLHIAVAPTTRICENELICCAGRCVGFAEVCPRPDGGVDGGLDAGMLDADMRDAPPLDGGTLAVAHLRPADAMPGTAGLLLADTIIDTDALTIEGLVLPAGVSFDSAPQIVSSGAPVAVLRVGSLEVSGNVQVRGGRPFVIIAETHVRIAGLLDLGATAELPGPGGFPSEIGEGAGSNATGKAGGGGAGHLGPGAQGGRATTGTSGAAGEEAASPTVLRGGAGGGRGVQTAPTCRHSGLGGGGGGVLQISAGAEIVIASGGVIDCGGGGGSAACPHSPAGGSGGGAGGTVYLQATRVVQGGTLVANGGAGGGGGYENASTRGQDGSRALAGSLGGDGRVQGGAGGALMTEPETPVGDTASGGGGGGSAGPIYIEAMEVEDTGTTSPRPILL